MTRKQRRLRIMLLTSSSQTRLLAGSERRRKALESGEIVKPEYANYQILDEHPAQKLKKMSAKILNLDNKRIACKPLAAYPSSISIQAIGGFHEQSRVG
jgi:muconolactone delta-isomerase